MKFNPLFEIVYLLLDKKKMTSTELARHFEVSKRTILRDVDALSMAGIPIYTTKGKGGGISLLDHYVLDKTVISDDDQRHILFALKSLAGTSAFDSQTTLAKLEALFGHPDTSWIDIDFSRWGKSETDHNLFEQLKTSILEEKGLSFTYANASGAIQTKNVYPLKLQFKSRAWYLHAYCLTKKDYRLYKINRLSDLVIQDSQFSKEALLPPEMKKQEVQSTQTISLTLLFSKEIAFRAYDEFHPKEIKKKEDGSLLVITQLPEDYWLYSFLLSLGTYVKVLSPPHVQKALLEQVTSMKKMYVDL